MFIAMNRFKVIKGSEAAFENVWLSRDSHLEKVPGFVEFHLLKGPEAEGRPKDKRPGARPGRQRPFRLNQFP
jgi:heme-degrading monooxygenase HmoA